LKNPPSECAWNCSNRCTLVSILERMSVRTRIGPLRHRIWTLGGFAPLLGHIMHPKRFHRRNRLLYGSKLSSDQIMKCIGRVWLDLLWNICMQCQTSVRNDCAQNGWMDRSAIFHRQNLMIDGSMEAPWLDLYWVGMNLQSGHRSTADL
jgi:hypothetical protein